MAQEEVAQEEESQEEWEAQVGMDQVLCATDLQEITWGIEVMEDQLHRHHGIPYREVEDEAVVFHTLLHLLS